MVGTLIDAMLLPVRFPFHLPGQSRNWIYSLHCFGSIYDRREASLEAEEIYLVLRRSSPSCSSAFHFYFLFTGRKPMSPLLLIPCRSESWTFCSCRVLLAWPKSLYETRISGRPRSLTPNSGRLFGGGLRGMWGGVRGPRTCARGPGRISLSSEFCITL